MARLKEFIDFLDIRASEKHSYIFDNPHAPKASEVFQAMMRHSKELKVYFKDFSGSISKHGNFIKTLEQFLSSDENKLQILVDDTSKKESRLYNFLIGYLRKGEKSNLEIREAHENFKNLMVKDDGLRYFAVADEEKYRVESDNEHHIAVCDFYDPTQGATLSGLFDTYYSRSKPVSAN